MTRNPDATANICADLNFASTRCYGCSASSCGNTGGMVGVVWVGSAAKDIRDSLDCEQAGGYGSLYGIKAPASWSRRTIDDEVGMGRPKFRG